MPNRLLFTSRDCGFCADAKDKLKKSGVSFKEVSVDTKKGMELADKLKIEYVPHLVECKNDECVEKSIRELTKN